jgi:hypothetical protein
MAMTAKQKEARWKTFVAWYELNVGSFQRAKPIPAALKEKYMANDGAWGTDRAMMWIRIHDPNYLYTKEGSDRSDAIKSLYETALGYKINWKDKRMANFAEAFARANPNINVNRRLTEIFMQRILPSAEFKKTNPGFASWLNKNRQVYTDSTSIMAALGDYNTKKEQLSDFWASKSTQPMPKELLDKAMANDWESDNLDFLREMTNTTEWAKGASYQDRASEFDQNWKSIFGNDAEVDPQMKDAYSRNISGLTFSDFFHTQLKNSDLFKEKMPGYRQWEVQQHAAGKPEGGVDIFDYFTRRNELVEMWNENFTGGEIPDQTLLDEAMKNNWGDALFRNKIRATPQYANTGSGKDKAVKFDQYWKGVFGEFVPVDNALKSRFIGSDSNDPSIYWDDIKKTDTFKNAFTNWDVFSQAQSNAGVNVIGDPLEYNRYKEGFKKAFTDIGMEPPEGLDRTIFASGVSAEDLQQRANLWKTTDAAYKLQTGGQADLAKTLGVQGNTAQNGEMRLRMQAALEKQRALTKSKFATVDTSKNADTGFIKQNI